MSEASAIAVILAAGKGTRMKSELPKVLHKLAGAPMLSYVLAAAKGARIGTRTLVLASEMEQVGEAACALDPELSVFVQQEQLGTADAVKSALKAFAETDSPVLILYGDTPLIRPETLLRLREALENGADLVVAGFETANPTGYGRLLRDETGALVGIREEKDAGDEERAITLCNSGIMGFAQGKTLATLLARIGNDNANGEYYLTDAVALAREAGLKVACIAADASEVLGVNSRAELAEAEFLLQERLRAKAMEGGATLIDPESVFLSHDTIVGKDVTIEPNVCIGPGVMIGDRVTIRAFCHIEQASIGEGAIVGPFTRLRPGASLASEAHVGNFVEIKQAEIGTGAKINHLTYIGDASVGENANIGAGTITCNYDGVSKHRTEIGAGAFIGSNSALVAPVKIGEGAYIGSGSVISKDVAADALALTRAPQEERQGWAKRFRERLLRLKQERGNKA